MANKNRPKTNYNEPVACKECGRVRPEGKSETHCVLCANVGHNCRLMGHEEMMWCAWNALAAGYEEKTFDIQLRAGAIDPRNDEQGN